MPRASHSLVQSELSVVHYVTDDDACITFSTVVYIAQFLNSFVGIYGCSLHFVSMARFMAQLGSVI